MWWSEESARAIVTKERLPGRMAVRAVRVWHLAGGALAVIGGLKLLVWGE